MTEDKTTFEESNKIIVEMPVAHLVSSNLDLRLLTNEYLWSLLDAATHHIREVTKEAGLTEQYDLQMTDFGEVEETIRVRRIMVHLVPKPLKVK